MDLQRLRALGRQSVGMSRFWKRLIAYVRIPNKSPMFDPQWESHGHMEAAVQLMPNGAGRSRFPACAWRSAGSPARPPCCSWTSPASCPAVCCCTAISISSPNSRAGCPGWAPGSRSFGTASYTGRGGADDGYAVFSSLTAIAALKEQKVKLARCVLLIEACEESGSVDLPAHLDALGDAIGDPSLVVCLDAECGNYEQVWCTTSLRGNLTGRLRVRVLTEGVHSGMATGIAPTPFRIVAQLLARVRKRGDRRPAAGRAAGQHSAGPPARSPRPRGCWETKWPANCRGPRV